MDGDLEQGRQAHARHAWTAAHELLSAADADTPLGAADLELLAETSDMLGRPDDGIHGLRRAFQARVDEGRPDRAFRCAYWLCTSLQFKGDHAQASAWLARTRRLADDNPDCPEQAYLLLLEGERTYRSGQVAEALGLASRALELSADSADPDLAASARMGLGMALVKNGDVAQGLAQLDEAMVAVTGRELSPRATGLIYCVVIGTCHELHDVDRCREWTSALAAWCEEQPDFTGAYRGLCRVHRVEILQLGGAWPLAIQEAELACRQLTDGYGEVVAGAAFYRLAELHRLRGEFADAERDYRSAARLGWDTQPGQALLRLAQGRCEVAVAAIRRALTEATDPLARWRLLPAAVEVLLAAGDVDAAATSGQELVELADEYDMAAMHATSAHAIGAVQLAQGDPQPALTTLRRAWRLWRDLAAPYEAGRARVLVALACRALGDEDSADMELDAARAVFGRLGAAPDVTAVDALGRDQTSDAAGLSRREIEVIRLVAAGKTNQAIAAELFLSEKTVARHLSNIFTKLGVGSRTAAAAYAFEHGMS